MDHVHSISGQNDFILLISTNSRLVDKHVEFFAQAGFECEVLVINREERQAFDKLRDQVRALRPILVVISPYEALLEKAILDFRNQGIPVMIQTWGNALYLALTGSISTLFHKQTLLAIGIRDFLRLLLNIRRHKRRLTWLLENDIPLAFCSMEEIHRYSGRTAPVSFAWPEIEKCLNSTSSISPTPGAVLINHNNDPSGNHIPILKSLDFESQVPFAIVPFSYPNVCEAYMRRIT